jgi:hypothetical protein
MVRAPLLVPARQLFHGLVRPKVYGVRWAGSRDHRRHITP